MLAYLCKMLQRAWHKGCSHEVLELFAQLVLYVPSCIMTAHILCR